MESIIQFRQMMADQKFYEVQRLVEVQLTVSTDGRHELLEIYVDAIKAQQKKVPDDSILELSEMESELKHHDHVLELLSELSSEGHNKNYLRVLKLKAKAADDKGLMNELYDHLSSFLIHQFEHQIPFIPQWIQSYIERYFQHDFNLKLKELALCLMLNDNAKAESLTQFLITSSVERSSPKGISSKLGAIADILKSGTNKGSLEIYQNYCSIAANGITDKSDYKRLVEMVIFFDEFKFQVLVLNLLNHLKLDPQAEEYATAVRQNKNYNFVYFDKFYPHLKPFFHQSAKKKTERLVEDVPAPDLKLSTKFKEEVVTPLMENEDSEDEQRFHHLLKYQEYTSDQLCDLAVSFIQSEMPKVALNASKLAMAKATDDQSYLKGAYLKLTTELQLKDYRASLDTCMEALTRATSRDDILSFLYGQAEIYIRLGEVKNARRSLTKILSIDSKYRMAKERLARLNEI